MRRSEIQHGLGMTMVLISGTMLFATLLMGYAIYRTSATAWPPVGTNPISLGFPILSTLTIVLSSYFMRKVRMESGDLKKAKMNLDTTLVLGFLFMGLQTLFWNELKNSGLLVSSGIFSSVLYGFTWIHAAHVVMGLMSLLWLRFVLKTGTRNLDVKVLNVEKFWHFLGVIWIIMFLTLFVL
ncbi:MAG: cytochrome c oxidase subunit 3 [Bdellovibrionota bacterium]